MKEPWFSLLWGEVVGICCNISPIKQRCRVYFCNLQGSILAEENVWNHKRPEDEQVSSFFVFQSAVILLKHSRVLLKSWSSVACAAGWIADCITQHTHSGWYWYTLNRNAYSCLYQQLVSACLKGNSSLFTCCFLEPSVQLEAKTFLTLKGCMLSKAYWSNCCQKCKACCRQCSRGVAHVQYSLWIRWVISP